VFMSNSDGPACGFHPWPLLQHAPWRTGNVATDGYGVSAAAQDR